MEQKLPPFESESREPAKKRWAFLRRGRTKPVSPETNHGPESRKEPESSNIQRFAKKVARLLSNTETPLPELKPPIPETPQPTEETLTSPVETIITRRRRWGEKILLLVASTTNKIKDGPSTPERSANEAILNSASTDMQSAQDDLDKAGREPAHPEQTPQFAQAVKREVKRTLRSIKVERERLRQADPPSETAQMLTLGVLALFGGGLLLSAWQEQKIKKVSRKLAKQEQVMAQQETTIQKLEEQVETHNHGDTNRPLVQRLGAFTHEQAAITREVAQEVKEYKAIKPELQTPETTFRLPEMFSVQSGPETLAPGKRDLSIDQPSTTSASANQSANIQIPFVKQVQKAILKKASRIKRQTTKDPLANYTPALVIVAVALVIWFLFLR